MPGCIFFSLEKFRITFSFETWNSIQDAVTCSRIPGPKWNHQEVFAVYKLLNAYVRFYFFLTSVYALVAIYIFKFHPSYSGGNEGQKSLTVIWSNFRAQFMSFTCSKIVYVEYKGHSLKLTSCQGWKNPSSTISSYKERLRPQNK